MGDDLWQRFLRAEKEVEEELKDVVTEVSTTNYSERVSRLNICLRRPML